MIFTERGTTSLHSNASGDVALERKWLRITQHSAATQQFVVTQAFISHRISSVRLEGRGAGYHPGATCQEDPMGFPTWNFMDR